MYFQGLADRYRLSMMNIVVVGSGSDPRTVVRKAKVHKLVEYLQSLKSESDTNYGRRSRNKRGHRDLSA